MPPTTPRLRILSGWSTVCSLSNPLIIGLHFSCGREKLQHYLVLPFSNFIHDTHASIVGLEMDSSVLMKVCVVGGNAVSAFLSWRLQATNACDVTLVWKSGFDAVHQYGISFKYVLRALSFSSLSFLAVYLC
jgi:hypothetical protein